MLYFSKNTGGFYDNDIHVTADIPSDALEITPEQHQTMLTHLNSGGRIELGGDDFVFIQPPPDSYYIWNDVTKEWETNAELQKQKQADDAAMKQTEITALLALAAQRISEYKDLLDFSETPEEAAAGEAGYNAWRQYRASLLKYQKGLITDMPLQPE